MMFYATEITHCRWCSRAKAQALSSLLREYVIGIATDLVIHLCAAVWSSFAIRCLFCANSAKGGTVWSSPPIASLVGCGESDISNRASNDCGSESLLSLTYTSVSEGHQEHTPSPDRAFLATQSPQKQQELTPSPEKASSPAKLVWELSPSPKKEQTPTLPPFHGASSKSRQQAPAPVKHNSPNPEKLALTLRSSPSTPSRSLSRSRSATLSPGHTQITVHVNPLVESQALLVRHWTTRGTHYS